MFAADAATFIADYGDAVSWTHSVTNAVRAGLMVFDQPDADMESGRIISREYEVTFETAAWPGLKREEVLVIGGTGGGARYSLRTDPHQGGDGVFSIVRLTKV